MIYTTEKLKNALFFDIETLPKYKDQEDLNINGKHSEIEKVNRMRDKKPLDQTEEDFFGGLSLIPELNKVINITFGRIIFNEQDNFVDFKIKSFSNLNDEIELLNKVFDWFEKKPTKKEDDVLAGYNILAFDISVLQKKYIQLGKLPKYLNTFFKKPWEVTCMDIMLDWKGSGAYFVSLGLLCDFLGVDNPKENEITGATIYKDFLDGKLTNENVAKYAELDVTSAMKLALKLWNN
jgi:hypothetical protein